MLWMIAAAAGYFTTGNDLARYCENPNNDACIGYVTGVIDAHAADVQFGAEPRFCLPENVTQGQVAAVVKKYLDEYPERRHYEAAHNVRFALKVAFPCKEPSARAH